MTVVPLRDILQRAFDERYGVMAINVVNDLTMRAVLDAAVEVKAPIIIQTSVKTVKAVGAHALRSGFVLAAAELPIPATLHLDHCPDRRVISQCIAEGWNSVLFDGSGLEIEDVTRQTMEVVEEAHGAGVDVEGEIEGIRGVEDGVGSDAEPEVYPTSVAIDFIRRTGIDCFAPAIGNAHGMYASTPTLDVDRVSSIVAAEPVPIALHGGTGMTERQFSELIALGCAKINISTALKRVYLGAHKEFLATRGAEGEPLAMLAFVQAAVKEVAISYIRMFRSEGRAW